MDYIRVKRVVMAGFCRGYIRNHIGIFKSNGKENGRRTGDSGFPTLWVSRWVLTGLGKGIFRSGMCQVRPAHCSLAHTRLFLDDVHEDPFVRCICFLSLQDSGGAGQVQEQEDTEETRHTI